METAFIQADRAGLPANRNCFAALEGFAERGIATRLFFPGATDSQEYLTGTLTAIGVGRSTLVHGTIPIVHTALRMLGANPPAPLDYPEPLQPFLGRRIWETTLGEVRDESSWPMFMKPRGAGKAFGGILVRSFRNLLSTLTLDDGFPVWASEPMPFASEWRVFVLKGEIVDVRPYSPDPFRTTPDRGRLEEMVAAYEGAPAAYALDVGVAERDGGTYLVEANDGYALGTYGLDPRLYANMIQTRWEQLLFTPVLEH